MSYVKRLKKLGKDICPEGSVIRGRTIREVIKSIDEVFNGGGEIITNLAGTTWIFDDPYKATGVVEGKKYYNVNFNYPNSVMEDPYKSIVLNPSGFGTLAYRNFMGNEENSLDNSTFNWKFQDMRTITIIDGDDIENPDLISWLEANATQVE